VDYWNNSFLPVLKEFKKHVAKYERFDLEEGTKSEIPKVMPELEDSQ